MLERSGKAKLRLTHYRMLGESDKLREVVDAAREVVTLSPGCHYPRLAAAIAALNPPAPPTVEERVAALEERFERMAGGMAGNLISL